MAKYKVGDKVRVKSKEWYDENKSKSGTVYTDGEPFVDDMAVYCGAIASIVSLDNENDYYIDIDNGAWIWNEDVFEDEPIKDESKPSFFTNLVNAIHKVVEENKQGITLEEKDGSIIITPIEDKEEDLPIDTPVMCSNNETFWFLGLYKGSGQVVNRLDGKSQLDSRNYIIPFDKFNPNDIEESLKYNVVK